MSKLSFRARALDASKPMPIFLAEDLPDLPDYSAINRAVPQMPSGMEKEEECEHHLQRAICTGLIIPTPEVCQVEDMEFYEQCYPSSYKMPKQHIHMQPLWQEQETPEYDIDSEDDRWLKQQRHPELTELKFEQMMDKLERSSGQTVVTLSEAKLLLERQDDLVIAVYDYWLNKRLKTQHPLILSVRTENRPGQSANNPYLAFRRRTEKMQTRKNRKNDESSYEKMLKLRRDLARALTLLELVARREKAKRDLLKLTAMLADKRYTAKDFAGQMIAEIPQSRPAYTAASLAAAAASFRREAFAPHYVPPPRVAPPELTRPREKRPYKRRKFRHHPPAGSVRDSGVYTSSEEEGTVRAGAGTPPDDGPFAFRRKAGCFYEMPTATLYGDPVDPNDTSKDALFEHEVDTRHRYTLTSVNQPYPRCVGFCRRRVGRGGRVALDRVQAPAQDLWPALPFTFAESSSYKAERKEEVELETERHRNPKEMVRDYNSTKKYPWRHAFRRHLKRNPHLWTESKMAEEKKMADEIKMADIDKMADEAKMAAENKMADSDIVKSDISDNRTVLDETVRGNLVRVLRKRGWESDSDSSYDSDASLEPAEKEFEQFIDEVNKKWLHFRPKTPPPSPPSEPQPAPDELRLGPDTPFTVELGSLDPFTTTELTLNDLYGDLNVEDISGDDLLNENLGLTEAQVESILSDTDLKSLAEVDLVKDKKAISEELLEELVMETEGDSMLTSRQRRRSERGSFGCSTVTVGTNNPSEPIYVDKIPTPPPRVPTPPPKPVKQAPVKVKEEIKKEAPPPPAPSPAPPLTPKPAPTPAPAPSPAPSPAPVVREPAPVPVVKVEARRPNPSPNPAPPQAPIPPQSAPPRSETLEEISLSHGVQLKTVQTRHSPLKKHIITARREQPPPLLAVASDGLKQVRLQSHLAAENAHNGPYAQREIVTVSASVSAAVSGSSVGSVGSVGVAGVAGGVPRRAPVVLAPARSLALQPPLVVAPHAIHHVASNKLKVLHAHPLTQSQRTQLLAQSRAAGITSLPAVVSLAALGDSKTTPAQLQLKTAPGAVTQFFEIKSGQLGKGPHLVNVVRQPQPVKTTVARLELNDAKKRQVVATFDGTLKGNISAARPQRVSVSLDGRQIVRAALPSVRAPVRHQIQLKNRTLVATPQMRASEASTSITIAAPTKTASIPSSVVANLLQKNVQIPKSGQKIAISGAAGQALGVQALAFSAAQLKARQARLVPPRATPVAEIIEAAPSTSTAADVQMETDDASTNGAVRRRAADNLPMEVT